MLGITIKSIKPNISLDIKTSISDRMIQSRYDCKSNCTVINIILIFNTVGKTFRKCPIIDLLNSIGNSDCSQI